MVGPTKHRKLPHKGSTCFTICQWLCDPEGLAIFKEIDDYFGEHSEEYTISDDRYFNLIDLSDEKCIVIGDKNAVFLLNKMTGLVKLLYNRPQQFVEDFKNNRLTWIFD